MLEKGSVMERSASQTIGIVILAEPTFASEVSSTLARSTEDISIIGVATSLVEAIRVTLELRPDVVLIDEQVGGVDAYELVQGLLARVPDVTTLVAISGGDIANAERLILSGASAFIVKPFDARDLSNTLARVKRLRIGMRPGEEAGKPQGRIIAVCGPKGGVGRTTVAVNLAVALAQLGDEDVVLVDASPSTGDIDLMLNLHPVHTLGDIPSEPEEIDDRLLASVLVEHASGIRVLAGWPRLERLEEYRPAWLAKILTCLRDMAGYVVVDLDSTIDSSALMVLNLCDWAILVVTPEITALRSAVLLIRLMSDISLDGDKLLLALNRADSQGGVPARYIQQRLGRKMAAVMDDYPIGQDDTGEGGRVDERFSPHLIGCASWWAAQPGVRQTAQQAGREAPRPAILCSLWLWFGGAQLSGSAWVATCRQPLPKLSRAASAQKNSGGARLCGALRLPLVAPVCRRSVPGLGSVWVSPDDLLCDRC